MAFICWVTLEGCSLPYVQTADQIDSRSFILRPEAFYSSLEASGTSKCYTDNLASYQVWEYDSWIANQCRIRGVEE
ncbi:hypothetical protein AHAS_Ahas17G0219400 [Arachis hypogaea]